MLIHKMFIATQLVQHRQINKNFSNIKQMSKSCLCFKSKWEVLDDKLSVVYSCPEGHKCSHKIFHHL